MGEQIHASAETRSGLGPVNFRVIIPGDGTYRAELPSGEFLASSIDEFLAGVRAILESYQARGLRREISEEEEQDDEAGFEQDLDHVLTKNAELYRV